MMKQEFKLKVANTGEFVNTLISTLDQKQREERQWNAENPREELDVYDVKVGHTFGTGS